jgi:hypothetical protein
MHTLHQQHTAPSTQPGPAQQPTWYSEGVCSTPPTISDSTSGTSAPASTASHTLAGRPRLRSCAATSTTCTTSVQLL